MAGDAPFVETQRFGESTLVMALSPDRRTLTITLPSAELSRRELQRLIAMLTAKHGQMAQA